MSYGFTCGYCEENLDTPFDDAKSAAKFAQEHGWRMTYGVSPRWGDGANNTCPNCIPINAAPDTVIPIYVP